MSPARMLRRHPRSHPKLSAQFVHPAGCERAMPLPVAYLAAAIAGLHDLVRSEDDQPADAVDLRLKNPRCRIGDRPSERAQTVVRDQLWENVEHVTRLRDHPLVRVRSFLTRERAPRLAIAVRGPPCASC